MFNRMGHLCLSLSALALAATTGCGLDDGGAQIVVFSTHHATPEDGIFPDKGLDDKPRIFTNDLGWEVTLLESYITIESVTVVSCDEAEYPLDMFWGPCPEDLRAEDLNVLTVAGTKLPAGDYCELWVDYGPYVTPVVDEGTATRHETPSSPEVLGSTAFFDGGARIDVDGDALPFELRADGQARVVLSLRSIDEGFALHVGDKENFPLELTISKTYDRFFDGIDFANYDPEALEANLLNLVDDQTRVNLGTRVAMDEE